MILWSSGLLWKLSQKLWFPVDLQAKICSDIKIHNFSFNKDFVDLIFSGVSPVLPYDSISGEELSPCRRLSAGCLKTGRRISHIK